VTLLLVLTSLALAAALIVPLASMTTVEALTANQEAESLRHRLAADSLIAVLPEWLERDRRIAADLDRDNRAVLHFQLGEINVDAVLQDDSAKLPLTQLYDRRGARPASGVLADLSAGLGLPAQRFVERSSAPLCPDDLFVNATDAEVFGSGVTQMGWCTYTTTLGRSVNVHRADPAVLEALLSDVKPDLGRSLVRQRQHDFKSVEELLAPLELTEIQRRAVQERLTLRTERYSLLIRTQRGDQVRRRYVVISTSEPPDVLIDWEVAP
jgi:hypothetical protein